MRRVGKIGRQKVFPKVKNVNVESPKNRSKLLFFLHTLANPIIIASYGRKYFQLHRNPRCNFFIPLPSSLPSSLPSFSTFSTFPFIILYFYLRWIYSYIQKLVMLIYIGCGKRSEKRARKFGVLIIHFLHCLLHLFFHSPKARSFPLKRERVVERCLIYPQVVKNR